MKFKSPTCVAMALSAVLVSLAIPQGVRAQQIWRATAGAQSKDMGKQAIAFLPNEMWIHAGDSITWTSGSGDIHTVSFFVAGQEYSDSCGLPRFLSQRVEFQRHDLRQRTSTGRGAELYREVHESRQLQSHLPGSPAHDWRYPCTCCECGSSA